MYSEGVSVPKQIQFVPATRETQDLFLMEYIEGKIMNDVVSGSPNHPLWKDYISMIANLHQIDWEYILPSFKAVDNYPEILYQRRLSLCQNYNLVTEVSDILDWLVEESKFQVDHSCILHGDLHPLNVIVRETDDDSSII